MVYLIICIAILFCVSLIILILSSTIIKFNKIVVEDDKIDRDIDIVFVSDFHVGLYTKKKKLRKIIDLINKVNGEYLLIGGDIKGFKPLKYYKNDELKEMFDSLKIKKRYFVNGNHEDYNLKAYEVFHILNDEIVSLSDNVKLVGLDWVRGENLDYKLDRKNYNILLSHYPDRVNEYSKIDLALGAHSHGHQVNLPLCKFHHKEMYSRGLYNLDNNKKLYVNRGLGFSFLKVRFLSTREIVKIELRCSKSGNNERLEKNY